jgi:hypothetical protein
VFFVVKEFRSLHPERFRGKLEQFHKSYSVPGV